MIWFPAAFLAGNISFEPVDDSSARVTLTDHGQTASGTLFFDKEGRVTDFVVQRYRTAGASSPETWSTPITGYGEFEGPHEPIHSAKPLPIAARSPNCETAPNWQFCAADRSDLASHRGAPNRRSGPPEGGVPAPSHVPLTALLITNGDAGLCIRMRCRNSLTSADPGVGEP